MSTVEDKIQVRNCEIKDIILRLDWASPGRSQTCQKAHLHLLRGKLCWGDRGLPGYGGFIQPPWWQREGLLCQLSSVNAEGRSGGRVRRGSFGAGRAFLGVGGVAGIWQISIPRQPLAVYTCMALHCLQRWCRIE